MSIKILNIAIKTPIADLATFMFITKCNSLKRQGKFTCMCIKSTA